MPLESSLPQLSEQVSALTFVFDRQCCRLEGEFTGPLTLRITRTLIKYFYAWKSRKLRTRYVALLRVDKVDTERNLQISFNCELSTVFFVIYMFVICSSYICIYSSLIPVRGLVNQPNATWAWHVLVLDKTNMRVGHIAMLPPVMLYTCTPKRCYPMYCMMIFMSVDVGRYILSLIMVKGEASLDPNQFVVSKHIPVLCITSRCLDA